MTPGLIVGILSIYFPPAATLSFRILLGNSGDGGDIDVIEEQGDIIESGDSDFTGGLGSIDGLRVMNDFNEKLFVESFDAFVDSAVLGILHKTNQCVGIKQTSV